TWWRQLAPFKPQGLCVGYLFVHRLEALAGWLEPRPVDPLLLLVLEALDLEQRDGSLPADLAIRRLHVRLNLDMPVARRLLHSLADLELLERPTVLAGFKHAWEFTDQGRQALQTKKLWSRQWRRG